MNENKIKKLPEYFKPILWSYDFSKINVHKDKEIIIINSVNYGDLKHWRWIAAFYGKAEVAKALGNRPASEIRSRVLPLASLLFGVTNWNYVPRSVGR